MNKNIRVGFSVPHKDDSVSHVANTITHGDLTNTNRRYIYATTSDNDMIELHDAITDDIIDMMSGIFTDSVESHELDAEFYNPYSLVFIVKRDEHGNKTLASQSEIIPKLKEFRKNHISKFKPYQMTVYSDGLETKMIPFLTAEMVFTEIRLTGDTVDYENLQQVSEALLEKITSVENNITTQVMLFYDNCMKISHQLHLLDVNQDTKLIKIFNEVAGSGGFLQAVEEWLPELQTYATQPITQRINLSTSDRNYMYQYKLEDVASKDFNPLLRSSIKCLANTSPKVYADMESGYTGGLHSMMVNKSHQEDWVERIEQYNLRLPWSYTMKYSGNPTSAAVYTGGLIGSNDQLPNYVSGTFKLAYKTDVPSEAMLTLPWLQLEVECYNTNNTYIKTVLATWDNGTTKRSIPNTGLAGTYKFAANLGGNYKVKYRARVYWGTFGSWSEEVEIAYFGLDRGNNSGGTWYMNPYIFNNQSNRVLTRVQLINASKYEKNVIINGRGYGWGTSFNPALTWSQNNTFSAPGSANYWYARFYGKIYQKSGCNNNRVEWHNVRKTKEVDMSSSMKYSGTAKNYGILTSVVISLTATGMKAAYYNRKSNKPYIYPSIDGGHTFMLKGGYQYDITTDAKQPKLTQTGVYKVQERTFEFEQNDTYYSGANLITEDNIIIANTNAMYELSVLGDDVKTGVVASAPRELYDSLARTRALMLEYPDTEKGLGQLYNIPLKGKWGLHKNFYLICNINGGGTLEIPIDRSSIEDTWSQIYNGGETRLYAYKTDNDMLCVVAYGANIPTIRLMYRDESTLMLGLSDKSGEVVFSSKLGENGDIPIVVNDKTMYLEMDDYVAPNISSIEHDDGLLVDNEMEITVNFNKDMDSPELIIKDSSGNIIGTIKK